MIGDALILAGVRVLVVEDVEENLRLFRALLSLEGAQVLEATSGPQGIDLAAREAPDLIVMDMQMPGMDGLEATRLLRADPRTRGIPIVVVTASAMEEDRRLSREAGCDGYITKPIDPPSFAAQLASFLPGRERA